MPKPTTVVSRTLGVDLGDTLSHVCCLDPEGEVAERFTVPSTREGFGARFGRAEPARVVMEVGTHSPWVSRLLEGLGHEVIVANSRRMPANPRKTDRNDAEFLARWGRADPRLLFPIRHRDSGRQAHLAILRSRDAAVSARTKIVNHVRGASKSWGVRLPPCAADRFHERVLESIPQELSAALVPLLAAAAALTRTIQGYDGAILELAERQYPETAVLRQVPGVGPVTALGFVLVLNDCKRISRSRSVGAYLGLAPGKSQSGAIDPQLPISKSGDPFLRRLLVQCAQCAMRATAPDSDLKRAGARLASVGGKAARKRAVVAVARRIAVLLHSLWRSGEVYAPLRNAPAPT